MDRTKKCPLCKLESSPHFFILTICKTCQIPMVVSDTHKPDFSMEEKDLIVKMFPGRKIRWTMRSIPTHAHCHIEGKE